MSHRSIRFNVMVTRRMLTSKSTVQIPNRRRHYWDVQTPQKRHEVHNHRSSLAIQIRRHSIIERLSGFVSRYSPCNSILRFYEIRRVI